MTKPLRLAGKVAFWLSWPLLWVYLRLQGLRTRLLLVVDGHFLAVQPRLGDGRWELPGGGIKRGEASDQAVLRELYEETGVKLAANQLRMLTQNQVSRHGLRVRYLCYFVELPSRPPLRTQRRIEVGALSWQPLSLAAQPDVSPEIRQAVQAWSKR